MNAKYNPNLDAILNERYYLKSIQAKGARIKYRPSNLGQEFSNYKKCIKDTIASNVVTIHGEVFTQEFFIDEYNYYFINWCIPTAKKLILENHLKPEEIEIKDIIDQVRRNEIDQKYLPIALKNEQPIIIAYYPACPQPKVVIDGNHRVLAKYDAGIRTINTFDLSPHIHLLAMTSDLDRLLYKIHHNLTSIGESIAGYLTTEELKRKLFTIY